MGARLLLVLRLPLGRYGREEELEAAGALACQRVGRGAGVEDRHRRGCLVGDVSSGGVQASTNAATRLKTVDLKGDEEVGAKGYNLQR